MDFRSVLVTRSYEQVIQRILERIRSGEFGPGYRLPTERELAVSFGVSRGVIREALKVLGSMGLVESRQGRGTFICSNPIPSISKALTLSTTAEEHSIHKLYELREALDVASAKQAAMRRTVEQAETIARFADDSAAAAETDDVVAFGVADNRFHAAICDASASPYVTMVLSAVRELQGDIVVLFSEVAGSLAIASGQHRKIAVAILAQDARLAGDLMSEHVQYSFSAVRDIIIPGFEPVPRSIPW